VEGDADVLENVLMPMLQNVIKRINQLDARMSVIEQKLVQPVRTYQGVKETAPYAD
jgi:hypothetical protein